MDEKPKISYTFEHEITIDENGNESVDTFAYIMGLNVPKDLRNRGFAKKLLRKAVYEIKSKDPKMNIYINAKPTDDSVDLKRLCDFYQSEGFVLQGPIEPNVLLKME